MLIRLVVEMNLSIVQKSLYSKILQTLYKKNKHFTNKNNRFLQKYKNTSIYKLIDIDIDIDIDIIGEFCIEAFSLATILFGGVAPLKIFLEQKVPINIYNR